MKCPSCGLEVADGANFCSHCGNAINVQGKVATPAAKAPAPDQSSSYYMAPPPDQGAERTLWDENPSMRTAIPGIVLWILIGIAVIIGLNVAPIPPFLGGTVGLIISGIVAIIVIGVLVQYWIRFHSIRYRLSTQRIFVTYGIFNKRTDEVELEKYKDIFVNQGFWNKIVGCGDIEVITGDVTNPTIKIIDVLDPIGKKELIRSAARERKSVLGINRREEL